MAAQEPLPVQAEARVEALPIRLKHEAMEDEDLLRSFRAGDEGAFEMLYLRYGKRVRGIAGRFATNAADADDLVQDVFIKAYRALPAFRGDCQLFSWLYQIAVNTGMNYRRRRRSELCGDDSPEPETDIGPEQLLQVSRRAHQALGAIEALPPGMNQALLLNAVRGLDYQDVGDLLGCPVGTVRSRISRARRIVAGAVND